MNAEILTEFIRNPEELGEAQEVGIVDPFLSIDEEFYTALDDGNYLVRLLTLSALKRESDRLQHSIGKGTDADGYRRKGADYLSLRNVNDEPLVTLEVFEGRLLRLVGRDHRPAKRDYIDVLAKFLKTGELKIEARTVDLGYIIDDAGVWHKIEELPNFLITQGSLDMRYIGSIVFPEVMVVRGDLSLLAVRSVQLPRHLTVMGNLDLYKSGAIKLSDHLAVQGDLDVEFSSIREVPNDAIIGGKTRIVDLNDLEGYIEQITARIDGLQETLNPELATKH